MCHAHVLMVRLIVCCCRLSPPSPALAMSRPAKRRPIVPNLFELSAQPLVDPRSKDTVCQVAVDILQPRHDAIKPLLIEVARVDSLSGDCPITAEHLWHLSLPALNVLQQIGQCALFPLSCSTARRDWNLRCCWATCPTGKALYRAMPEGPVCLFPAWFPDTIGPGLCFTRTKRALVESGFRCCCSSIRSVSLSTSSTKRSPRNN